MFGAVASSAPVKATLDFSAYSDVMWCNSHVPVLEHHHNLDLRPLHGRLSQHWPVTFFVSDCWFESQERGGWRVGEGMKKTSELVADAGNRILCSFSSVWMLFRKRLLLWKRH